MKTWVVPSAGILLLALLWAGARTLRRRPAAAARRLAQIVWDVFGDDWAKRLDRPAEQLRAALERGADPRVARELGALVTNVDVRFDRNQRDRDIVGASIVCRYADDASSARAHVRLPWDAAPADVRAEFLRGGATTAVRQWTVPVP